MILPATAADNGGLCMPCKNGTRQQIEESKALNKKLEEYDPVRELWLSLVHRVHDTAEGFDGLTDDEKLYFAVCILEGEVYNGGFHQFFSNSSGELFEHVVSGLTKLNAQNSLKLLRHSAKVLFGDTAPPVDRQERWELMKHYPEDVQEPLPEWVSELGKLDETYWDDPDNLGELLDEFAKDTKLLKPFERPET